MDLDIFIRGENVNLCIPDEEFAKNSEWYSWFNDEEITKYLEQGQYPNTRQNQMQFYNSHRDNRLILIIRNKLNENIGVISLSFINIEKRGCDIALVVGNAVDRRKRPYLSIEAMALMITHGFNKIGLDRINAGQHIELKGWQQRLELIGFKLEGLHPRKFVKGRDVSSSMSISVSYEDFERIASQRGGKIWDSLENMKKRIQHLPKESFLDKLLYYYDNEREEYYRNVFNL